MLFKFKKNSKRYETKNEYESKVWVKRSDQIINHFKTHYKWWVLGGACLGFVGGGAFYLMNRHQVEPSQITTLEVYDLFPTNQEKTTPTLNLEWSYSAVPAKETKEERPFEIQVGDESIVLPFENYRWSSPLEFEGESIDLTLENEEKITLHHPDTLRQKQNVTLTETEEGELLLSHLIDNEDFLVKHIDEISYDILNQEGKVISTLTPTTTEDKGEVLAISCLIEEPIVEEALLFVRSNLLIDQVLYHLFLTPLTPTSVIQHSYQVTSNDHHTGLLNQSAPHLTLANYHFFAESLHLTVEEDIVTYQLVSPYEKESSNNYYAEANKGILLKDLPVGDYFLYLNDKPVYLSEEMNQSWYTIQREGGSKKITLTNVFGLLGVSIETVQELPETVYDLIIDPGHGGDDPGAAYAGYTEAEETLVLSEYLKQRFEDHGLKVKLTREEDVDPAQQKNFDYNQAPYVENGRVDQVYRYQAKYTLSNHLNALYGSNKGTEIYSSIVTDDTWSRLILDELTAIDRTISDSERSQYRVSEGSYKRYYACPNDKACRNPYVDYLYMIRETGGFLTDPITLTDYSVTYSEVPNYGSETILIEYAYLDNRTDRNNWLSEWELWAEAVVRGTLAYLDIPYEPILKTTN